MSPRFEYPIAILAVTDLPADRQAPVIDWIGLVVAAQVAQNHGQVAEGDGGASAIADALTIFEGSLVPFFSASSCWPSVL